MPVADTASDPPEKSTNASYRPPTAIGSNSTCDYFASYVYKAGLNAADYIKVYHDLPYTLSLRSILDAYQYRPDNRGAKDPLVMSDAKKVRVLKGARLAFMDERSKAALLM